LREPLECFETGDVDEREATWGGMPGADATSFPRQLPAVRWCSRSHIHGDSAYAGPVFHEGLAGISPGLVTEIVRRSDRAKGFVVLPERWIVERTIGWLDRCRRLAKDWENLTRSALAFLRLASIRLMLRKLCNAS
jgi:transposase